VDRILVIEDDQRLASHICRLAQEEGLYAQHFSSMVELDHWLGLKQPFDIIVLDRLLGGLDTKSRVHQIKQRWPSTPILVLSAINTPLERAEFLNLGVDDYLGKPFLSQELLARVRALMRRFHFGQLDYREIGDLVLDLQKRVLIRAGRQEFLPAKEFMLFKVLTDDMGRVLSRMDLLDLVWSNALEVETNVVEATIANLRRRLNHLGSGISIKNSRNVGYWVES
jgi:DNA-binding response OmpR family regulator